MMLLARALIALAALLAASPAAAQTDTAQTLPSAERMLAVFVEDAVENRDGGKEGIVAVRYALGHPGQLPRARLDSLLAGLEGIAVTSDVSRARIRAVMQLSRMADSAGFERMMRVYRAAAAHPDVRDMVVSTMGKPKLPRHVNAWVALLAELATAPAGVEDFPNSKFEAMKFLLSLGAPGHQRLIDIHRRNLARDPEVRATLAEWVRLEFKVPESAPGS
jgi:hypothetical protein